MRSPFTRAAARAAALLIALLPGPALALDPGKPVAQLLRRRWGVAQGLPAESLTDLCQDRDGYLWVGTSEGLVRFDGASFEVFRGRNHPGMSSDSVTVLAVDPSGALWIGTWGGGVMRYADGVFSSLLTADGLPAEDVSAVACARNGDVWVGTPSGLVQLRGGKVSAWRDPGRLSRANVRALHVDRTGALWVGTVGRGVHVVRDGVVTVYPKDHPLSAGIEGFFDDPDGTLWAVSSRGLYRIRADDVTVLGAKDGLPEGPVTNVLVDRDHSVWIAIESRGLARLVGDRVERLTESMGLASDSLTSLAEDREGNVWVATSNAGLVQLRDRRVAVIGAPEGLNDDLVYPVFTDRSGTLWVGTAKGGPNRIEDGRVSTLVDPLFRRVITAFGEAADGTRLFGTFGTGVVLEKGGAFSRFSREEGLPNPHVYCMAPDGQGGVYVGTARSLSRYHDGTWEHVKKLGAFPVDTPVAVFVARSGDLWISSRHSIVLSSGGSVRRFLVRADRREIEVTSFLETEDGILMGTNGAGLLLWKKAEARFEVLWQPEGPLSGAIHALVDDGLGSVWLETSGGIVQLTKAELRSLDVQTLVGRSLSLEDGLRAREPGGGVQQSSTRLPDGRLAFATARGVAFVDPRAIRVNPVPPPVRIEAVLADGRPLSLSRGRARVPAGTRRVEIRFTALSLSVPEKVRFSTWLDGFDPTWTPIGRQRTASYTNLPPGDLAFRVKACNDDGVWNEEGASLALVVAPFFWQTWSFRLGFAFLLLSAALAAHRRRVTRLTAQKLQLEAAVAERTKELEAAHARLESAQARIAELMESSAGALLDLDRWSSSAARDIAAALGVPEIGVFVREGDRLQVVAGSGVLKEPSLEALRSGPRLVSEADSEETIVTVAGLTGEVFGALVVPRRGSALGEAEKRLLTSFAHQLGGALELSRVRRELAKAESEKRARRREMVEAGLGYAQVCGHCRRCFGPDETVCPDDGFALSSPGLLPHRIETRYRLTRLLGEGGMGTVYEAWDEKLGRVVALKIIRSEKLGDASWKLRFAQEARLIARIGHPSVITVYDSGELADGSAFLVMERLHGLSLGHVLDRHRAGTPRQVAAVLRQGAAALGAAHRLGLVHRDVKPDNVFLGDSRDGLRVTLLDFGLAKAIDAGEGFTLTGAIVGTPSYMSPEQIRGLPVDARSDLYSFAAVAYEALTGYQVALGKDLPTIFMHVLGRMPPPLSKLVGLPAELDAPFFRALAKSPEERPASVAEWVASFVDLLEASTSSATGWPSPIAEGSPFSS